MASANAARELYIVGLRNAHAVESQAQELMERQSERLTDYPKVQARVRQHLGETKQQIQRIEEILSSLDESHSMLKDLALKISGNMAAIAHAFADDEIIKNSLANYAFEHFEIATYKSLLLLAEQVGHQSAVSLLNASLREEQQMAQWIDDNLRDTTMEYLMRYQQKAA